MDDQIEVDGEAETEASGAPQTGTAEGHADCVPPCNDCWPGTTRHGEDGNIA